MLIDTDKPIKAVQFGKVSKSRGRWHSGIYARNHMLIYFTGGSMKMQVGDAVIAIQPEDILLIPQGEFYRPLDSDGVSYYFFHFHAPQAQPKQGELRFKIESKLPEGQYAYYYIADLNPVIQVGTLSHCAGKSTVKSVFERAAALRIRHNPTEKLLLDGLVRELLVTICDEMLCTDTLNEHLRRIMRYIDDRYWENITLSGLSETFGLSASYIARLFKKELKTTTVRYINGVRIGAACELLLSTGYSIGKIAEQVGFENQYYFSRVFRSFYQMTPGQFRRGG